VGHEPVAPAQQEDDLRLDLDVDRVRPAFMERDDHGVIVVGSEDPARLDLEVLPLARPVEQRVHHRLIAEVVAAVRELRRLGDH